jgi:hypothetical protein
MTIQAMTSHSKYWVVLVSDAFQATFSDFRLVKGRKVCQIVLEVPIEGADKALSVLGGLPNPAEERWVGVARIEHQKKHPVLTGKDLWRASSDCAMVCKETEFWDYLKDNEYYVKNETEAIIAVRNILGIASRSDLDHNERAVSSWSAMYKDYKQWLAER